MSFLFLNSILGGSVNSRLFQKIREDSGLAYTIYSYGSSYRDTGLFHIYAAINPSQVYSVIKKIVRIVSDIKRTKGVTPDELSNDKRANKRQN